MTVAGALENVLILRRRRLRLWELSVLMCEYKRTGMDIQKGEKASVATKNTTGGMCPLPLETLLTKENKRSGPL